MASSRKRVLHYRSSTNGATPTSANLKQGEIAINDYADEEKLFIKNSDGDIVSFNRIIVDNSLDSGSTNPVANSAITSVILEDEEIVAGGLADLNSRIASAETSISLKANSSDVYTKSETYTKSEVEALIPESQTLNSGSGTTISDNKVNAKLGANLVFDSSSAITLDMDDELDSGSTKPVTNEAITTTILDIERTVALALTQHEKDIKEITATTLPTYYQTKLDASSGITISSDKISVNIGENLKFDSNSAITIDVDDELNSGSTNPVANSAITKVILDDEKAVAASINDLDTRVVLIEDSIVSIEEDLEYKQDTLSDTDGGYGQRIKAIEDVLAAAIDFETQSY